MSELLNTLAQGAIGGLALGVILIIFKAIKALSPKVPSESDVRLQELTQDIDPETMKKVNSMFSEALEEHKPFKGFFTYFMVFIAILAITIFVARAINSNDDSVGSQSSSTQLTDLEVHNLLKEVSSEFAGTFPKKIDSETTVIGVSPDYVNLRTLVYFYKIETVDIEDWNKAELMVLQDELKNNSINYFCSQPSMKDFRDINVSVEYNYSDKNSNFLFSNFIGVSDC